jgi:hypothetical protein
MQTHTNKHAHTLIQGTYGYASSDLAAYYKMFGVKSSVNNTKTPFHSGVPGGDNFGEGTLDTQLINAIGQRCHTLVANTNTSRSTEESFGFGYAFLDFLTQVSSVFRLSSRHTLSTKVRVTLDAHTVHLLKKHVINEHS